MNLFWWPNGSGSGGLEGYVASATPPLYISGSNVFETKADGYTSGYLSSIDWNIFNNKQPAGTYVTNVTAGAPLSSSGGTTPNITTTTGSLTETASDILTITGSNTLFSGTTIKVTKADSTHDGYLSSADYNTFNGKLTSPLTTKGDLFGYSTTNARVPIGSDGYVLVADSAQALGLRWATAASGTGTVTSVDGSGGATGLTLTGGPITSSGTLTLGGTLALTAGGTGSTTAAGAIAAISPLTTKGDVLTFSTVNTRLPVGSDGYILAADSTQTTGLKWVVTPATGVTSVSTVFNGTSANAPIVISNPTTTPVFTLTKADGSHDGYLVSTDWSTFNSKQNALTLGNLTGSPTGVVTVTGGTGAVIGSGTSLSFEVANGSQDGYLSSADYNTFNGKLTSPLTTKGDVLGFSTVNARIPVGTNGSVLTADSTQALGLKWTSPTSGVTLVTSAYGPLTVANSSTTPVITLPQATASNDGYLTHTDWSTFNSKQAALTFGTISSSYGPLSVASGANSTVGPNVVFTLPQSSGSVDGYLAQADFTTFNNKLSNVLTTTGDIIYSSSGSTAARRAIGATGTVLTVSGGVPVWAAPATSGTVTSVDVSGGTTGLTTSGGPVTSSGTITLAGTLAIGSGGTGQTTASAAFGALSPLTTKGDVLTFSTVNARLGVGTNGQVLSSDSTQTTGLKWIAAGTGTVTSVTSAYGPLTVANTTTTPVLTLTVASASSDGYVTQADWSTFNSKAAALSGTNNTVAKFTSSSTIGNSSITDDATSVAFSEPLIMGTGDATGTTTPKTIRGPNRTGTNVAGSALTIQAGNGTGTGGGGSIIFQTGNVGATGSSADTIATCLTLGANGTILATSNYTGSVVPTTPSNQFTVDFSATSNGNTFAGTQYNTTWGAVNQAGTGTVTVATFGTTAGGNPAAGTRYGQRCDAIYGTDSQSQNWTNTTDQMNSLMRTTYKGSTLTNLTSQGLVHVHRLSTSGTSTFLSLEGITSALDGVNGSGTRTVTTYYGLRLTAIGSGLTVTNPWGLNVDSGYTNLLGGSTQHGDGTVSLPGLSFVSDTDTGMYRIGANNVGIAANGAKVLDIGTTGLAVTGISSATGIISTTDTTDSTSGSTGSIHTTGGLGVTKALFVASATNSTSSTTGGGIFSGGIGVAKNIIAAGQITSTTKADGNSSTAITCDMDAGNVHTITLTGNTTVTISNARTGGSYVFIFTQDATGTRTVAWSPTVTFVGGTPIQPATGNGAKSIFNVLFDGSTYYVTAAVGFS